MGFSSHISLEDFALPFLSVKQLAWFCEKGHILSRSPSPIEFIRGPILRENGTRFSSQLLQLHWTDWVNSCTFKQTHTVRNIRENRTCRPCLYSVYLEYKNDGSLRVKRNEQLSSRLSICFGVMLLCAITYDLYSWLATEMAKRTLQDFSPIQK